MKTIFGFRTGGNGAHADRGSDVRSGGVVQSLRGFYRIRILYVLFESDVCVADIAEALNMTQSAISHQLRILKQAKLVSARRDGKSVIYSLADDHVRTIIAQGQEHICE